MAPRAALRRISRDEDFRRVYRNGTRRGAHLVVLHHAPNDVHVVRLGIAVGRRCGGAVVRNRLRRRLREAVRAVLPRISGSVDVIVVARAPAGRADYAALRDDVAAALKAAGLLITGGDGER
jgi:ribonuclease P protein component